MPESRYILESEADLLEAAAAELEARGWTHGAMLDGNTGQVCTVGALSMALFNEACLLDLNFYHCNDNEDSSEETTLGIKTLQKLSKHLDMPADVNPQEYSYLDHITSWNDTNCSSKEQAIEMLRKAAKSLREENHEVR